MIWDMEIWGYMEIQQFLHLILDKMAFEGQKWTQFYSAASVCTPSRAALA